MKNNRYEVIVGNVGMVHDGKNRRKAEAVYAEYRRTKNPGRASGETVTLMVNGEPEREGLVGTKK